MDQTAEGNVPSVRPPKIIVWSTLFDWTAADMNIDPAAIQRELVDRCEIVMSHAWMVRTFVKHSEEAEDFPELMNLARVVFDTSRALETKVDDPPAYLHMLRKKIGKLRKAAEHFRTDAAGASTHMNFQQAVKSMDACVADLEQFLQLAQSMAASDDASSS